MPAEQRGRAAAITMSGIAFAVAAAAFPPWHWTFRQMSGSCGYSFIGISPEDNRGCSIDIVRLMLEWAAIGGLVAIASMLRRGPGTTPPGAGGGTGTKPPPPTAPTPASENDIVAAIGAIKNQTPDNYFPNKPKLAPSPTPSPQPPATLPAENRSGVQPPISLDGRGSLSEMDRAKLWNLALIQNEQERRERVARLESASLNREGIGDEAEEYPLMSHMIDLPLPRDPMPHLIDCLRKLEAMPKGDVATETNLRLMREIMAERKRNPMPGDSQLGDSAV